LIQVYMRADDEVARDGNAEVSSCWEA